MDEPRSCRPTWISCAVVQHTNTLGSGQFWGTLELPEGAMRFLVLLLLAIGIAFRHLAPAPRDFRRGGLEWRGAVGYPLSL